MVVVLKVPQQPLILKQDTSFTFYFVLQSSYPEPYFVYFSSILQTFTNHLQCARHQPKAYTSFLILHFNGNLFDYLHLVLFYSSKQRGEL